MSSAQKNIGKNKLKTGAYMVLATHIDGEWDAKYSKCKTFKAMRLQVQKQKELMEKVYEYCGRKVQLTDSNIRHVVIKVLQKEYTQTRKRGSRKAAEMAFSEKARTIAQVLNCLLEGKPPTDHQQSVLRQIAKQASPEDHKTQLSFQAMSDSKRSDPFRDPDFVGRHLNN